MDTLPNFGVKYCGAMTIGIWNCYISTLGIWTFLRRDSMDYIDRLQKVGRAPFLFPSHCPTMRKLPPITFSW